MAVGVILYALVHGLEKTRQLIPEVFIRCLMAIGLLLFVATGAASLFLGAEFPNYSVLGTDQLTGQHIGIILIELGVGITVAAVMVAIFMLLLDEMQHELVQSLQLLDRYLLMMIGLT